MSYIKNFEKMMNDFLKEKYPDIAKEWKFKFRSMKWHDLYED